MSALLEKASKLLERLSMKTEREVTKHHDQTPRLVSEVIKNENIVVNEETIAEMDKMKQLEAKVALLSGNIVSLINHCEIFEKNLTSLEHKNKELEEKVNELEEEKREWMWRETVSCASISSSLQIRGKSTNVKKFTTN